jgi:hypothetical protein
MAACRHRPRRVRVEADPVHGGGGRRPAGGPHRGSDRRNCHRDPRCAHSDAACPLPSLGSAPRPTRRPTVSWFRSTASSTWRSPSPSSSLGAAWPGRRRDSRHHQAKAALRAAAPRRHARRRVAANCTAGGGGPFCSSPWPAPRWRARDVHRDCRHGRGQARQTPPLDYWLSPAGGLGRRARVAAGAYELRPSARSPTWEPRPSPTTGRREGQRWASPGCGLIWCITTG